MPAESPQRVAIMDVCTTVSLVYLLGAISAATDYECTGITCRNGGTFQYSFNGNGDCECICLLGYAGTLCEIKLVASRWPDGPYALLRPHAGCPEPVDRGWRPGYIYISTATEITVLRHETARDGDNVSEVSEVVFDGRPTNIVGPFGSYTFQLNFCFKQPYPGLENRGEWPDGNYSIYGGPDGCPHGFSEETYTYNLPDIRYWRKEGHLPYLQFTEDKNGLLVKLCHQRSESIEQFPLDWGTFVLLQTDNAACDYNMAGYEIVEETLSLIIPNGDGGEDKLIISYCHFWSSAQYERFPCRPTLFHCGRSHCIEEVFLCDGSPACMDGSDETDDVCGQACTDVEFHCGRGKCIPRDAVCNDRFDCKDGRDEEKNNCHHKCDKNTFYCDGGFCIPRVWLCDGVSDCWDDTDEDDGTCSIQIEERCANGIECKKRHCILRPDCNGTVDCGHELEIDPSTSPCYPAGNSFHCGHGICVPKLMVCDSILDCPDGRDELEINCPFRCLITEFYCWRDECITPDQICHQLSQCGDIAAEYSPDLDCNSNLGMNDGLIEDFQLSASSWREQNPPQEVRPALNSWCPEYEDTDPYVQIDFYTPIVISGLVIYNRVEVLGHIENNQYFEIATPIGCQSFRLSYATFPDDFQDTNVVLELDPSMPYSEPQTVSFLRPLVARLLRVHLVAPPLHGDMCLRLELLGCRGKDRLSVDCNDRPDAFWVQHSLIMTTASPESLSAWRDNVTTLWTCQDTCSRRYKDCTAVRYVDGLYCNVYKAHVHYEAMEDVNLDSLFYIKVCLSEEEEPQYVLPEESYIFYLVNVSEAGSLNSVGYPFSYSSNMFYNWKIVVPDNRFVRLTFIDIALNRQSDEQDRECDYITIYNRYDMLLIDWQYNGVAPSIPTPMSTILVKFSTCPRHIYEPDLSRGFRLVYQLEAVKTVMAGPIEDYPTYIVTHALIGQLKSSSQTWLTSRPPNNSIALLTFAYFNIPCHEDFRFKVDSTFYCNSKKPRNRRCMFTELRYEYNTSWINISPQGFSATFTYLPTDSYLEPMVTHTETVPIDENTTANQVCSSELNKCYLHQPNRTTWKKDNMFCHERGYSFVNVHSLKEMLFLRSWMTSVYSRVNRFGTLLTSGNDILFTYIGLQRYKTPNGLTEIWEDGSQVSLTMWDIDEPKDGFSNLCTEAEMKLLDEKIVWRSCVCNEFPEKPVRQVYHYALLCEKPFIHQLEGNGSRVNIDKDRPMNEPEDMSKLHKCTSGDWIYILAVCDGMPDCTDGSDEKECNILPVGRAVCSDDEFRCLEGECIHLDRVCNHVTDCQPSGNDEFCEFPSCKAGEFSCRNYQCVPQMARCDAVQDCLDGSDEIECADCAEDAFLCGDLTCIHVSKVCDNYFHCIDGRDESNCAVTMTTCYERWMTGYTSDTWVEVDGEDPFECKFDLNGTQELHIVTTIDIDVTWGRRVGVSNREFVTVNMHKFRKHAGACKHEIRQQCMDNEMSLAGFYDPDFSGDYSHCAPTLTTVTMNFDVKNECVNYTTEQPSWNPFFIYDFCVDYDIVPGFYKIKKNISIGPVVCKAAYPISEVHIGCEDGGAAPRSQQCLYDNGKAGNLNGCRNGRHLDSCESFECPAEYVKCPGSFCLGRRFVCDGKQQCPDGVDETNCWCDSRNASLAIVYNGTANEKSRAYITSFARQFYSPLSPLYTVSYTLQEGVPRQYQLRGSPIHPFSEILNTAPEVKRYSLEERLLVDVASLFPNDTSSSVDIILIRDGQTLSQLSSEMFAGAPVLARVFRVWVDQQMTQHARRIDRGVGGDADIILAHWDKLASNGAALLPELCNGGVTRNCSGQYRCLSSRVCIPLQQVCDGISQCAFADDEEMCDFRCHHKCSCQRYITDCKETNFIMKDIDNIPDTVRKLDISNNQLSSDGILTLPKTFAYLLRLLASECYIRSIADYTFENAKHLIYLDLSNNRIRQIKNTSFVGLSSLRQINLQGNTEIETIEPNSFKDLRLLTRLSITGTKLSELLPNTFAGLEIDELDISDNKISKINGLAFNKLASINVKLDGNNLKNFDANIFSGLGNVKKLETPAFKFCCYKPSFLSEEDCYPHKDEFSSCEDLMRNSALQTLLWIIGILSLLGNLSAILYRVIYDTARLKTGFGMFVTNLAVSDFLMGVYMITIAIADLSFRNRYIIKEDYWRNSGWCNFAGILATVSSETSVFFLCLITIDRIIVIKFPFKDFRFNTTRAAVAVTVSWVISWFIAVIPIVYSDYFKDSFYSMTGVCLALPLTRRRPPGWLYSFMVFVGLNFTTFILIAIGQLMIYLEIRRSSKRMRKVTSRRRKDLTVARNLLLVLTTDFLCWFPVGLMGILAMEDYEISGDVYAWTAVLILPINSALNPFLYTLSAVIASKSFTPRMNEQTIKTRIDSMTGKEMLKLWNQDIIVTMKPHGSQTLADLVPGFHTMATRDVVSVAAAFIRTVATVHGIDLILGDLSTKQIHIIHDRKLKLKVFVQSHPKRATLTVQKAKDVNDVGVVVKHLIKLIENV